MAKARQTTRRWSAGRIVRQLKNPNVLEGFTTWKKLAVGGKSVLLSDRGQAPRPLVIRCPLRGLHAVTVGTFNPPSKYRKMPGTLAVTLDGVSERFVLPSANEFGSFYLGTHRLKGGTITIEKASPPGAVGVSQIIFEKRASRGPSFAPGKLRKSPIVWGISDQNDQAIEIASADIRDIATGVRYHRELGFNTISWHMYLGFCEYPTQVGTAFPRVETDNPEHLRLLAGLKPGRAAYEIVFSDLISRYDCMAEGIRLAHEQGLTYMPCMRMNNEWHAAWAFQYFTQEYAEKFWCPEFFMRHPEYWTQYKNGQPAGGGMDYAHPAVRKYRLGILEEVMTNYPKIDGMFLDLHRHPPMVSYPDNAVAAFKKKTGIDVRKVRPLRDETMDPRWLKFRAGYFTNFMRGLKKAKRALGRKYPTVVRTAQTFGECLREGADIEAWLDEGLVDVLILEKNRGAPDADSPAAVIEAANKAGVKVLGGFASPSFVAGTPWRKVAKIMDRWMDEGAAGVAFYESNRLVCCDNLRKNLPHWVAAQG